MNIRINKENIKWIVVGIILLSLLFLKDRTNKRVVKADPAVTFGVIKKFYSPGTDGGESLVYTYKINGKEYKRATDPSDELNNCINNKNCIGKKFIVLYSKSKPSKSLINLQEELIGDFNPDTLKVPDSFDNFE
ncbi:MAG: hypothetical protein JXB00_06850 [Bacteroidales bacterium]|nr:hypothetical protein [Bacteroidales bacterium]